jgi:enediyne biosynthesis protein E4
MRTRTLAAMGGMPTSSWACLARLTLWPMLAVGLAAGCNREPEKPVIARPIPPTIVTKVAPATLPTVKFVDITKASGIDFVHENAAQGEKLLPETMGSGVAFLDFDGDGDQDLFLVNSMPWPGKPQKGTVGNRLYRNDGKGNFNDVTEASGLSRTLFGMGVAVGD